MADDRISTARWTGVFYLGLAVMGIVGFLFVRGELFVVDDPAATLTNLGWADAAIDF